MAVSVRDLDGDASLVTAAQAGDAEAFAELFRRHYPPVRRSCARRLGNLRDADEIAQATFVRAWERLDRCAGDRRFGGWVQVIAQNLCIDALRRRNRATPVDSIDESAGGEEPEHVLLRTEQAALVREALADLPPRQRHVVEARDLEDKRPAEIAAALGLTVGAVDSLLLRGRRRLATVIERIAAERGAASPTTATSVAAAASASPRVVALVGQVEGFINRVSYHLAEAFGLVPGVAGPIQRAAGAALLGGAIAASAGIGGGAPQTTPPVSVPHVAVDVPAVAAPTVDVPRAPVTAPVVNAPAVVAPDVVPLSPGVAPSPPGELAEPRVTTLVGDVLSTAVEVVQRLDVLDR